jgi:hypothetical protein
MPTEMRHPPPSGTDDGSAWRGSGQIWWEFLAAPYVPWWYRLLWWLMLLPAVPTAVCYVLYAPVAAAAHAATAAGSAGAGVAGLLAALGVLTVGYATGARFAARPGRKDRPRPGSMRAYGGLLAVCGCWLAFFGLPGLLTIAALHTTTIAVTVGKSLIATLTTVLLIVAAAGASARLVTRFRIRINTCGAPRPAVLLAFAYLAVASFVAWTGLAVHNTGIALAARGLHTAAAGLRWIPITGWTAWGLTGPAADTPTGGWALLAASLLLSAAAATLALRSTHRTQQKLT